MAATPSLPAKYRLFRFQRLDSTNDEALRRIEAGSAAHGDVIVADSQTAGRGRRGRTWQSPAGNLHLSLVVEPPSGSAVGQLAFVAALAMGEAVASVIPEGVELRYKWPNDLLLGGRKAAGVLIESNGNVENPALAIGIGINVCAAPEGTPYPATALRAEGGEVAAVELVAPLCAAFDCWYRRWSEQGFAPVRAIWLSCAHGIGTAIEARLPDGSVQRGVFRDLDSDGALVMEAGGRRQTVATGDIFFTAA